MKLIIALLLVATSGLALADTYVKGYTRSNGTYVEPHYRSAPDSNPNNNWSSQGNVNPHTGQEGTRGYQVPMQRPSNFPPKQIDFTKDYGD